MPRGNSADTTAYFTWTQWIPDKAVSHGKICTEDQQLGFQTAHWGPHPASTYMHGLATLVLHIGGKTRNTEAADGHKCMS